MTDQTRHTLALPSPVSGGPVTLHRTLWHLLCLLAFAAALLASPLQAAGGVTQDDRYVVYYNTLHTRHVPDAIAKKNGIFKSRERGLLTISVHRRHSDGKTVPVITQLSGFASHGNGDKMTLDFDIAEENGYISYSAPFVFPDGHPLDFEVNINPSADHPGFRLRFSRTLYAED